MIEDWKYQISLALPEGVSDETLCSLYNIIEAAITTVREEARAAAFREAIQIVDTAPLCHCAGRQYVDPVALVQRMNDALETANSVQKDSEPEGED